MQNICTRHDDKVYIECDCGCEIISAFDLNGHGNFFCLQYYGQTKNNDTDFRFDSKKDLLDFITYLEFAMSYDNRTYDDIEIGVIEYNDDNINECLCITSNGSGYVGIQKYAKNYKKFIKHYVRNKLIGSHVCIEYKKCKSDWDIYFGKTECSEFVNQLKNKLLTN